MQMLLFQCNFIIFDVFHVISDFALQHDASFLNCWHALGESPASGIEGRGRRPAPAWAGVEVKCLSVVDFVCWCPTTWHFRICSSWYCNVTQETTLSQNYLWNYAMFHCAQQISSTSGRGSRCKTGDFDDFDIFWCKHCEVWSSPCWEGWRLNRHSRVRPWNPWGQGL